MTVAAAVSHRGETHFVDGSSSLRRESSEKVFKPQPTSLLELENESKAVFFCQTGPPRRNPKWSALQSQGR